MSVNTFQISKDNLDSLLMELAREIRKEYGRKACFELVIVGGAAILSSYDFRTATTDIDAAMPLELKSTINKVGDKFGLPYGWLNNDFQKTSSYSSNIRLFSKPYKTFMHVLEVRTVKDEYLIAMKARSARPYKRDLSDIVGIIDDMRRQGKQPTIVSIQRAFTDLYGEECSMNEAAVRIIEQCMKTNDLNRLHQKYEAFEDENKEELLDFEERHPHILNEKNISQILRGVHESGDSFINRLEKIGTDAASQTVTFDLERLLTTAPNGEMSQERSISQVKTYRNDEEYEK